MSIRHAPTAASSATHVGLVSSHNEDRYASDTQLGLWVIADGMGGHVAGEIASQLAIETIVSSFRSGSNLVEAVSDAHPVILEAIQNDVTLAGMGTTAVAVHLDGLRYQVAWSGDSRCYLWSAKNLKQITRDHSYLEFLLSNNDMDAQAAYDHPERKSLTHAIGISNQMSLKIDTVGGHLQSGNYLLLCSDGLTDEVKNDDIAAVFDNTKDLDDICNNLINAALANGGRDNITITVIKAPDTIAWLSPRKARWLIAAGLMAAAALAYFFWFS